MTEPVDIDRKLGELRDAIAAEFLATGGASVRVSDIRVSLEEWRRLARAAGKQIARPVETVAGEQVAWAVLRDWPSTDDERTIHAAAMREAADRIRLPSVAGRQASGQGDIADDDPEVVEGMARLAEIRALEADVADFSP